MKNLILVLFMIVTAASFSSCNDDTFNKVKIRAAEAIQKVVESNLTIAYADVNIEGYDCGAEVITIGAKVYAKASNLLKIKLEAEAATKTLTGSTLLRPVCEIIGNQFLPGLIINSSGSDYKCLKYVGAEGTKKLTAIACSYL